MATINLSSLSKKVSQVRTSLTNAFNVIKKAATAPVPKKSIPTDNPLGLRIAPILKRTPNTTINLPKIPTVVKKIPLPKPVSNIRSTVEKNYNQVAGVTRFISGIPGEISRSYGNSLERLSTPTGRKEISKGVKRLITERPSLDTINNPAVQTALDVTDFLPGVGLFSGGLKKVGKEGVEKLAREGAEKVARESAEKATKKATQQILTSRKGVGELGEKITQQRTKGLLEKLSKKSSSLPYDEIPQRSSRGIISKMTRLGDQLVTESRTILKKMGNSGKEIADKIDNYNNVAERTAGKSTLTFQNATKGLKPNQIENVLKALDGQDVKLSEPELQAVKQLRGTLDEFAVQAEKMGLEIRLPDSTSVPFHPRGNYLPHVVDTKKLKTNRELAIKTLVDTGQIPDVKTAANFVDDIIDGSPLSDAYKKINPSNDVGLFGNLEFSRIIDWPSEVLRYDKGLLPDYFMGASRRLARANNFGTYDQEVDRLLKEVVKEGGDVDVAEQILRRNLNMVKDNKALSEGLGLVRQLESASKLGLSAVSNLGQSVNTATKLGVRNTLGGIKDALTPGGRDFALEIGATLDDVMRELSEQSLGKGPLGKITAPGFSTIERLNRTIAANAGKRAALKKGITNTDDIAKFAQEAVNATQFKTRPIDLPPTWSGPTGKLLTQFKNFSYKQGQFVLDEVLKPVLSGDIKPLARYLLLGLVVGEGIGDIKAFLRNRERPKDPFERALDNLATIGGAGTIQSAIEAMRRGEGSMMQFLVGPAVSDVAKLAGGVGLLTKGQPKSIGKFLTGNIPIVGQSISNELFPKSQPYKTGVPDLLEQGIEEFRGDNYYQKAADLDRQLKNVPQEKLESILEGIKAEDESLYNAFNRLKKDQTLKVTPREIEVRSLQIKDGSRPKAINQELDKLKTSDERKELLKRYVEIGVINDAETLEKVLEIRSTPKPQSSVEKGVETVLSAMSKPVKAAEETPVRLAPTNESKAVSRKVSAAAPAKSRASAEKNTPLIIEALKKEGIYSPEVLAYALATIEHETAGTFEPIEEYSGRQQAIRLGYKGGANFFGRGFIQLTHDYNYKQIGERIGLGDKLLKDPSLALDPQISAMILAAFFKDRGVANFAKVGNFVAARRPVNPDNKGQSIAQKARRYLQYLKQQ